MAMKNFPVHRNHVQTLFIIIGLLMLLVVPFLYRTHPPKVNSIKTAAIKQPLDNPLPGNATFSAATYVSMVAKPAPTSQAQTPATDQSRLPDESAPALADDLTSQSNQNARKPKPLKASAQSKDDNNRNQKQVEDNN
jgi:hypothetical protein